MAGKWKFKCKPIINNCRLDLTDTIMKVVILLWTFPLCHVPSVPEAHIYQSGKPYTQNLTGLIYITFPLVSILIIKYILRKLRFPTSVFQNESILLCFGRAAVNNYILELININEPVKLTCSVANVQLLQQLKILSSHSIP